MSRSCARSVSKCVGCELNFESVNGPSEKMLALLLCMLFALFGGWRDGGGGRSFDVEPGVEWLDAEVEGRVIGLETLRSRVPLEAASAAVEGRRLKLGVCGLPFASLV